MIFKISFTEHKVVGIISVLISSRHDEDRAKIIAVISDQNDLIIAGVERDETGAIIKAEHIKPDILILDLQLSGINGPEIAPMIHRRSPSTSIIMIGNNDEEKHAGLALKSGISGYLLKETDTDNLVPVIRIVRNGGYYVSSSITLRVFRTGFSGLYNEIKKNIIYSSSERRILTYIAQGFKDEEIAGYLNCSKGSIKNSIKIIKRRTRFRNRIQIAVFSLLYGLINPEHLNLYDRSCSETSVSEQLP